MSTTGRANGEQAITPCRPADVTAVEIDADELESTAPEYLRDVKSALAADGYQPATVTASACFADDCSLATQAEADRLRAYVRAASFLGAGRVVVTVDQIVEPEKARPALTALAERARREGLALRIDGPIDLPIETPN
ncbi:hypothetical protein ACNS7O_13555 [Haloferacaceae archaeon DSL9]